MKRERTTTDAERSAPEALEKLVRQAERSGASDIHLRMTGEQAEVAFRMDGVLTAVPALPEVLAARVFGRIKFLARLKTYQESLPQDGRIDKGDISAQADIRVATYPTVTGEKIVLRLFSSGNIITLSELGFADDARRELERFLSGTSGLLLLTGPAGSGKTTTIYACLRRLADAGGRLEPQLRDAGDVNFATHMGRKVHAAGRHIITIEDPVEQFIPEVMQTEVNNAVGLDFAKAARHLMRQDPEVLVIGEIRDEETANIAVRAALTGHMVIATLHAGSCRGVFERLFVMCEDRYSAVSAVEMVINQRLMRRVCAECGGSGCEPCLGTGYHGRVPVVEWVRVGDELRAGLREPGAIRVGPAVSLERAAEELVGRGVTDRAESLRVFGQ
ncbi:MAG: ATPase, T2SS/T4P/T4SS family [Planctomycetota bacterium]